MDLGLGGRVALVTASSRGLGRAVATELAAEGARVMITSRGSEQLARTAQAIAQQTGAEVGHVVADVSDADDVRRLLDKTRERFGEVEVLVHNAGGPPAGRFADIDDGAWQQAFELNVLSAVRLFRDTLPAMRSAGFGRIVSIASSSVKQPLDDLLLSNSLRLAVVGLVKTVAVDVASDGVLVNVLAPGRIATERVAALDAHRAERTGIDVEEVRRRSERSIPAGRYGSPAEFAKAAAFLASAANTYVTGQTVLVDGGMVRAV
jgi:3-oxoacyl-[acyl-carrier protein] reductase